MEEGRRKAKGRKDARKGREKDANLFGGKSEREELSNGVGGFFFSFLLAGFGAELGLSWRGCKGMGDGFYSRLPRLVKCRRLEFPWLEWCCSICDSRSP